MKKYNNIYNFRINYIFRMCTKNQHLELVLKSSSDLNPDINLVPSPLMITL
jgi:predicted component of type VI protein secretion system